MSYVICKTSAGDGKVVDDMKLQEAIKDVPAGSYVVWSNDNSQVLYTEKSIRVADDAQSCSGDFSSVVVKKGR